jgi:4-diphosphocytidyl-2-C-methyl-D-erythritol kinase
MRHVGVHVTCHAKLNLTLKVYGKRPDGYHDIISVMQSIDLSDKLYIEKSDTPGIQIACDNEAVPSDESNLIWKAAENFARHVDKSEFGLKISLSKGIPVKGGLAGGSSDAAGTIVGLNALWDTGLKDNELLGICAETGSDVPFCLIGGTALVRGRGEILESLPQPIILMRDGPGAFLLVIPSSEVETANAYNLLDKYREKDARKWESLNEEYYAIRDYWVNGILNHDFALMLVNDFTDPVLAEYPELKKIHDNLRNHAGLAVLTGSGSCMFAYFSRVLDAMSYTSIYKPVDDEAVILTHPVDDGVKIMG